MSPDAYDYLVRVGLNKDQIEQLKHDGVQHVTDLRGRTLIELPAIGNLSVTRSKMLPEALRKQKIRQVLLKPLLG